MSEELEPIPVDRAGVARLAEILAAALRPKFQGSRLDRLIEEQREDERGD